MIFIRLYLLITYIQIVLSYRIVANTYLKMNVESEIISIPTINQQLSQFKYIFQCQQAVIILVAIPGCGKSTLASYIVKNSLNSSFHEWISVNQDVYKSRGKTLVAAEKYLSEGKSVIIDRCNFDVQQRSTWIKLCHDLNIPSICLVLPHYNDLEICSARAYNRGNDDIHEENADWNRICSTMKFNFRLPEWIEGMNLNILCETDEDLDLIKREVFSCQRTD